MLIKTVAIYNRISRDNNEDEDVLLNHRTITTRLCEERGYNYKLYEEVISGGKAIEERPKLMQLMTDINEGLYDGLVVVELSRIERDNLYSQMVAKILEDNEVPIITTSRMYNLNDENDRLMYDMESMISSKELKTITRRMKAGKLERAKRGEWVQGVPPIGYKRNDEKKLEIEESEANLVKQIFNYAESGYGLTTIVNKLNGYKTRTGNPFTLTAVNTILKNQTYTGYIIYNAKDKKGNLIIEEIKTKNAHEAIISKEQFNSVQQALRGRVSGDLEVRNRSRGKVISMLKDLVYCKECGLKMGLKKDSKQVDTIYLKGCKCGVKGVNQDRLIDSFIAQLFRVESHFREQWEKALNTPHDVSEDSLLQSISELNKTAEKLKKRLEGYIEMRADGDLTREQFQNKKSKTEAELNHVLSAIDDLQEQLDSLDKDTISSQYEAKIKQIIEFYELYNARELEHKDLEHMNRLLKTIIHKVHYQRLIWTSTVPVSYNIASVRIEAGDYTEDVIELDIEVK
ncbi:recombinase family protein [Bacillus sp. MM2020_1]|nr:recombinase family protein [Bacillus sp. MM2020_1]